MPTYRIAHRTADQLDSDDYLISPGIIGETIATVEAANPAAARRAAESQLRTTGISWRGYTDADGCVCAWLTPAGIVALVRVAE